MTCAIAALGYAFVYAAFPTRTKARGAGRTSTRRWTFAGLLVFVGACTIGAVSFGPVLGPFVALAAALAAGSLMALVTPLFLPSSRS